MNTAFLESFSTHPLVVSVGWTLVHFVWQATLVGVVTAFVLETMRRTSASIRYIVACGGFAVMTIAPMGTFVWLVSGSSVDDWKSIGQGAATATSHADRHDEKLFSVGNLNSALHSNKVPDGLVGRESGSQPMLEQSENPVVGGAVGGWISRLESLAHAMQRWLPWCVVLWIGGVICLAIRLLAGLRRVWFWRSEGVEVPGGELTDAVSRLSRRMKLRQSARLLETARDAVPAVIGWLRPVILVPAGILTGLTTTEMDSILAHELAHIRRHDYLVNLLQTVVETLLFYHPAVWWFSSRIRTERENCCDDIAVEVCGNRVAFARALTRLEELRCKHNRLLVAANGGSLVHRIRRIVLAKPNCNDSWWPAGAIVLASLAVLTSGLLMSVASGDVNEPDIADKVGSEIVENGVVAEAALANASRLEDDEYPVQKPEVERVDSKTGQSHRVMADVKLSVGEKPPVSVDLKYSNLFNYTLIPERIAREVQAVELGVIDFGERPQPKNAGQPLQVDWQLLVPLPAGTDTTPIEKPAATESDPQVVTVDQLVEPAGDRRIVPYAEDALWIPDHLAFYGQNRNGQTKFRVVRIDKVDLGLGPAFGPVNALVMDDANTELGVLGSNWARIPRGKNGEGFVASATDGFHFLALSKPIPQNVDPIDDGEKILATHSYDLARRESTGWVEVDGVGMPIDAGVEAKGVRVHVTLMQTVVALDTVTGKVLWHLDEGKQSPTWRKIAILELLDSSAEGRLVVVELEAADGELRRRFHVRSGEEIVDSPNDSAGERPVIQILKRDGDRTQLASIESRLAGRDKTELIRRFQEILMRSGGAEQGGWVTDQETLVSAENVQMRNPGPNAPMAALDAQEVIFDLPEGAGIRAEFAGENVEIISAADVTKIIVTNGRVKLYDSNGVERADASPDGGAEQLVVEVRAVNGEGQLKLRTQRLKPDADYPQPPVQVKCNLITGALPDEPQPPHGAVRFAFENPEENEPARMKIRWHYDLHRLVEEAERESGRTWRDLLSNQGAPLQPAVTVPFQTIENPAMDDEDDGEWGPLAEKSGLQSRLTLMTGEPAIGQPLLLKLELRNSRAEPTEVDLQNYAPFRVLRAAVRQPDETMEWVPFIGMTPQTAGEPQALAPGEVITVWENVDATTLFLLDQEEAYQFFAEGNEWAGSSFKQDSNHLDVLLQPGRLPPQQALISSLLKLETFPKDWEVSSGFGAIYVSHSPTNLKRDVTTIQLWFTEVPLPPDYKLGEGDARKNVTTIGPCELGQLHLAAPKNALELWPEHVRDIRIAAARALNFNAEPNSPDGSAASPKGNEHALPWRVYGRVTDADNKPIAGATVRSQTGIGSLRLAGEAATDADGKYDLRFGPGLLSENKKMVQAATISVDLDGHFEKNLHRQGDRIAALEKPEGDLGWGGKTLSDLFLPGESKEINFVMLPATKISGMVIGLDGDHLDGVRVSLVGEDMPPSSSVVANTQTDKGGRFELTGIPTGFKYQILVRPFEAKPPWLAWASAPMVYTPHDDGNTHFEYSIDGKPVDFGCQQLTLILNGNGVNWKTALKEAADKKLELTWDGLSNERQVGAGMAFLELGGKDD